MSGGNGQPRGEGEAPSERRGPAPLPCGAMRATWRPVPQRRPGPAPRPRTPTDGPGPGTPTGSAPDLAATARIRRPGFERAGAGGCRLPYQLPPLSSLHQAHQRRRNPPPADGGGGGRVGERLAASRVWCSANAGSSSGRTDRTARVPRRGQWIIMRVRAR